MCSLSEEHCPRAVLLKLQAVYASLWDLVKTQSLDQEVWVRVCVSNKLLGDVCAAGLWSTRCDGIRAVILKC